MNNTGIATSGNSLGDCRTNVFPLADARGLHWKKFVTVHGRNNSKVSEDPILCAYSNAVRQGVLCAWQKLALPGAPKAESNTSLAEWGKELIVFWYGEEPQLAGIIHNSLQETENGCFEEGIPLEYQGLLFKSLHNLLERQLLSDKFFCDNGWFLKTCKKNSEWETLAFSFKFFIYGESLVAVSVNIQKTPSIRCLSRSDLSDSALGDGIQVVLAPAGLNAVLTGQTLMSTDAKALRILHEWQRFFPIIKDEKANGLMPCLVEVIHNDTKMMYPSCLVGVRNSRSGKKNEHNSKLQQNLKDEKPTISPSKSPIVHSKINCKTDHVVNKVWSKIDGGSDGSKSSEMQAGKKAEPSNIFGPNKPLWEFKDPTRNSGCGCTSTTNVNRAKPVGRFASNLSTARAGAGNAASPATSLPSTNQATVANQRVKKERKKISLPFHQRRSVERSPTPPMTVPMNFKGIKGGVGKSSNMENSIEGGVHEKSNLRQSPPHLQIHNIPVHSETDLERSIKYSQSQSTYKPTNPLSNSRKGCPQLSSKFKSKISRVRKPDYSLPVQLMPNKPALLPDLLEARTSSTDSSYASLYERQNSNDYDMIRTGIVSPIMLTSPTTKSGENILNSEVKIVRMPNKGLKRTTEQLNNETDGSKKAKLVPHTRQQQLQSKSVPFSSRSPSQPNNHLQPDTQMLPQSHQLPHSQTFPQLMNQNYHSVQPTQKRGPGRPRKQSNSATSLLSPPIDSNSYENDTILSPLTVEKRRKASNQKTRANDGLASPPPISSMKSGSVKSKRRPSKKDQTIAEQEIAPMMSPSMRSSSITLSPSPQLPSPVRTPGSTSGISFTHSKDLTVNISDLDKLFEGSDDEDHPDSNIKMQAPTADQHTNSRTSGNDDVFRTTMMPPVTSASLPHDLAEMFPTPPSQEPLVHATSPATSYHGEYLNPASATMCNAVMSPEKHAIKFEKRFEDNCKSEIKEGLEPPFTVPECQEYPVGDMFSTISILPSSRFKPIRVKNLMLYNPSWKTGLKKTASMGDRNVNILRLPTFQSKRHLADGPLFPEVPLDLDARQLSCPIPLEIGPQNTAVGNSFTRTEADIIPQIAVDKEIMNSSVIDTEIWKSIELVLKCNDPGTTIHCDDTSSLEASPYQVRFKHDQALPYGDCMREFSGSSREYSSEGLAGLSLNTKNESSNDSNIAECASRILELFKEQWLSPFSTIYLREILSQFYGIPASTTVQTADLSSSTVLELLYELNPCIQDAFKKPLKKRTWDTNKIDGPTTFQELHKLAGRTAQQSNLPVNPLLIGAEGDLASVSPSSLKYWKKLYLEPFGGPRDVAYVVVAPDSDLVLENTKLFFRELSGLYESLNLGKHCPITKVLRDGIIRVGQKVMQKLSQEPVDEWFSKDDTPESVRMKLIAQVCKYHLGPHLASLQLNRSLFEKSSEERGASTGDNTKSKAPGHSANSFTGLSGVSSLGLPHDDADNSSANLELPAIVIYMIDPFQVSGVSESKQKLWSFNGLLRAFSEMTASFSESLKSSVFLQIVPLESILQFKASTKYHNGTGLHPQDTHQLAFSVYSSCRMTINSLNNGKICTGFGPGSLRDKLAKKRQEESQYPTRIYLPPCVLARHTSLIREDPHSSTDLARVMSIGECNILFCCYCLSSDRSWLLVTCTDNRGLVSDTTLIKINSQNRLNKSSRSPRRLALRRLLNFIMDTVSFYFEPWRIVINRLGKPGKGELKDLYELINKMVIVNPMRPSTPSEPCTGCRTVAGDKQTSHIRSISLAAIQPEVLIKLLPVGVKKKANLTSRVYIVPTANQHLTRRKDKRPAHLASLPLPQHDELLNEPVFLLSQTVDEDHFMPMLPSPAEVANSTMLTSPQSDITQPLFSPGDGIISPHLTSPHLNQVNAVSPFQPIMQNSPSFSVISPLPLMPHPASTPALKSASVDDYTRVCRQPLSVGYIVSGSNSPSGTGPSVLKSELLLHVTRNDGQISHHPLESENHLELHRFILEQLESLSWLTVDPTTGKKHSALASHIYLLTKFYETFNYFVM